MPDFPIKRIVTRPLFVWTLCVGILAILYAAKLPDRPERAEQKMEERLALGKSVPVKYYVEIYRWWGAWPSLAICLVLLASGKWITRPLSDAFVPDVGRAPPANKKWVFIAVLAATASAAWINSSRLSQSLWDDEEYVMRRYVVGSYERNADTGEVKHDEPDWIETMFDTRRTTNHILYSTLARLSHTFHKPGDGPKDSYFSEPLMRLPSFLAGLASLGAIAWCLFTFGFFRAAMLAPFALIAHAWFTRLGVDARGYSLVLFAAPAAFATLAIAVRTGRWRWWFAFILAQCVCFFGFTGSVYILLCLNLTALILIWRRPGASARDRWSLFYRYFGVSSIFALIGIFIFLPCVPQILKYMSGGRLGGFMDLQWWQNVGAYLVSGAPWFDDEPSNPLSYHIAAVAADHPILTWSAIAALIAILVVGIVTFARSSRWPWLIALLGTFPLLVAHNYAAGNLIIHWYVVIAIPGLVIVLSVGATALATTLKGRASHFAFALGAVILVGSIGGLANRMNHLLRTHSYVPLRESVEATGVEVTNPNHPDFGKGIITVGFHQPPGAYDPGLWLFSDPGSSGRRLREAIARADRENRPLYVNFGLYHQALEFHPEIMALVANPEIFEPIAELYGLYGASLRHVFRYRPGSLKPETNP